MEYGQIIPAFVSIRLKGFGTEESSPQTPANKKPSFPRLQTYDVLNSRGCLVQKSGANKLLSYCCGTVTFGI
jgi:hypothetical protein